MRFFDFFAGIGGFRLGMEMAGHECVGHCEIDKYADMSYRAMYHPKESEVYFNDIRTVRAADMPECECYCGGFPCQSFSIAGKRGGFSDTRGTLFFEIMRLAKERRPEYIFLENVKGLLNHDGGDTFETIIRTMAELGYGVEWEVLNSKNFGVPQNRERVFIIGHLGGPGRRAIFPLGANDPETTQLQGLGDSNGIICNTLAAGDRDSVGTYVADRQTDRQTDVPQGKRFPQGITLCTNEQRKPKHTDIANALIAQYNTIGKYERTYVKDK